VFEELPNPPKTRSGVDALGKRDQATTHLLGGTQSSTVVPPEPERDRLAILKKGETLGGREATP